MASERAERNFSPAVSPQARELSLFRAAPALLVLAIAVGDAGRFADPDLWGHVRFGQVVLAQGHLILRDPYSYSAAGHLWTNHEWLSEVLMASLYNLLGVFGLKLMKLLCTTVTVVLLAMGVAETGAPWALQGAVVLLSAFVIGPQLQFRPQLFTLMGTSALLVLLAWRNYRGINRLWMAVPLLALWANLHGGFIIGVAALGAFSTAATVQGLSAGQGWRVTSGLWVVTALGTLATLATPYGIGTWQTVIHAITNPLTHSVIRDWQPLLPALVSQWRGGGIIFAIFGATMVVVFAVSILLTPKDGDVPLLVVAGTMVVAALMAVRNLAPAAIAIASPLARHSDLLLRRYAHVSHERPREALALRMAPLGWITQLVISLLAVQIAWETGLFSAHLDATVPVPAGAVRFMRARGLRGNILSEFGWGEYLIWHLSPESKVFVDGRYDTVYPPSVIEKTLDFESGGEPAEAVLQAYAHDFVLVRTNSRASEFMAGRHDWNLIYRDAVGSLYAHVDSGHGDKAVLESSSPESLFP